MANILSSIIFRRLSTIHKLGVNFSANLVRNKLNGPLQKVGTRFLFSGEILGVDKYLSTKQRVLAQFNEMKDNFFNRMNDYLNDENALIFTEDLKNALYLVEGDKDLVVFEKMLRKFHSQNSTLRFGSFVFGPVVMRMLHHFKKSDLAVDFIKDPFFSGFFNQLTSLTLALDLLFKEEKYQEVVDLFEFSRTNIPLETKYPRDALLLVIAACYKLNTLESLEHALETLKKAREIGAQVTRKTVTCFAALALNQKQPIIALEVLSAATQANYVTVRNLRLQALADLKRFHDIFTTLYLIINKDEPSQENKEPVLIETLEHIKNAVKESNDKAIQQEFYQIDKSLMEGKHIQHQSLDSLLMAPVRASFDNLQQQRSNSRMPNSSNRILNKKFLSNAPRMRQRQGIRDELED